MNLKNNINKIHGDFQNNFQNVKIEERTSKSGNYFEIVVESVKMIIYKKDITNESFNWSYYANPNNESSLVERHSDIYNICNHVKDIIDNSRFNQEYIDELNKENK